MSIVLTKTCQNAIVIVIKNGKLIVPRANYMHTLDINRIAQGSKYPMIPGITFFIECEIDLKLPSSISDLLPPNTLIKSQLFESCSKPEWSTTLTYCLSAKLLKYLVKYDANLRLKLHAKTLSDQHFHIFDMSLCDAKYLKDTRNTNEVQHYLTYEAPYIPITKHCNLELQYGLFVVDMPEKVEPFSHSNDTVYQDIHRICQNSISRNEPTQNPEIISAIHSEDSIISHVTGDCSTVSKSTATSSIPPSYQQIGNGRDLHTLYFNLVSTNYTIPLSVTNTKNDAAHYHNAPKAFCRYQIFGELFHIKIHNGMMADNSQLYFQVRGSRQDVLDWLSSQAKLRIAICIMDRKGREVEVGHSVVSLASIFVAMDGQQSFHNRTPNRNVPVFDNQNNLVLQSKTSICSLNLQAGLFPNWVYNEAETLGRKPPFECAESINCPETNKHDWLYSQDRISRYTTLSSSAYPGSTNMPVLHGTRKFTISNDIR
ncbi:hypothetical protein BGW37DRAFT_546042 [Umbelopsis sp. PMI_123]|nr:hypothetical protein BGW37DRAFT_546042 [Umbelopsis sp. PMI_123]